MAKLYWRIKRNGKWTWVAATPENLCLRNTRTDGRAEHIPSYVVTEYYDHNWEDEVVYKPEVYTDSPDASKPDRVCTCEVVGRDYCFVHRQG